MSRITVPNEANFSQLTRCLGDYGALLVSLDESGKPNPMTIGWAQLGIIWGRWIMTVLVRPSRYTYGCCNETGDFTVNVPYPSQADEATLCGTKSGRDLDKFAACKFTAAPAECGKIASPYIAECGLAYECKTVHFNDLIPANLAPEIISGAYPQGDFHRLFFGEVLCCHVEAEFVERFA